MIILGLAGPARAGKDTVADYLVQRHGFIKFAFSDALYQEVQDAFGLPDQELLRDVKTKEVPTDRLNLQFCEDDAFADLVRGWMGEEASPRQILQWWGTQYRRAQDQNYWLARAAQFVADVSETAAFPEQRPIYFVNTAVRFPNEQAWVREAGGNVWHIRRDGIAGVHAHVSETPLPVLERERELWNNGDIDGLYEGVDMLLSTPARFVKVNGLKQTEPANEPA